MPQGSPGKVCKLSRPKSTPFMVSFQERPPLEQGKMSSAPGVASALAAPKCLYRETVIFMSGVPSCRPWESNGFFFSKKGI